MKTTTLFFISIFIFFMACDKQTEQTVLSFQQVAIDTAPPVNPWAKMAADLDKDGLNDIIIGGQKGPLVWYKSPDWQQYPIAAGGYDTVDGEYADVDNDGDIDVIMGGLLWYENPGDLQENPEQNWVAHQIADHPTHDVEAADMDGDGDLDIVTRNQSEFGARAGNTIHLWIQETPDEWHETIFDCPHGEGIALADLDGDNDIDLITGGIWFENNNAWTAHRFAEWHSSAMVKLADMNADGRVDVVLTPSELAGQTHKISWFEAPVEVTSGEWIEHVVIEPIECVVHSLTLADFNGDGAVDIAYAEMHQGKDPDEVVVFLNGDDGQNWVKHVLSEQGSHGLLSSDVNNDGLPDLVGANWSSDYQPVTLWLNTSGD